METKQVSKELKIYWVSESVSQQPYTFRVGNDYRINNDYFRIHEIKLESMHYETGEVFSAYVGYDEFGKQLFHLVAINTNVGYY